MEGVQFDVCNWLLTAESPDTFCAACRHNRTIPDLSVNENITRRRKFELAKHRLFYTPIKLGLPLANRADDPQKGLVFDFVADVPNAIGEKVMTGHDDGLIKIDLKEADGAEREKVQDGYGRALSCVARPFSS